MTYNDILKLNNFRRAIPNRLYSAVDLSGVQRTWRGTSTGRLVLIEGQSIQAFNKTTKGVLSVNGNTPEVTVDNTDPQNPIINFNGVTTDGITITGDGTTSNPLIATPTGGLITSVLDTNTIDLDVTLNVLTSNVRYQDTVEIDLSDDTSGLKGDLKTTGVLSGTYGSSSLIPTFTVDTKGRLTFASDIPLVVSTLSLNPVGEIIEWTSIVIPNGWLLCDGTSYATATYPDLFTVIGYTYGGSGANFNVPDKRGRFGLGKATSGTGSTLGGTGGLIDHLHTVDPPNTTTGVPSGTSSQLVGIIPVASATHTHNVDIGIFNSGTANPPFQVFNYIIRYTNNTVDFNEASQDAIGTILVDTNTVNLTYSDGVPSIIADVITQMSITSDALGIKLSGDVAAPGNSHYYGTNGIGVKGYFVLPTGYSDEEAQDAVGTILLDSSTIDFTYSDATPSITAIVIDDSISNTKLRNSGALSVIGRSVNSAGDPADISATATTDSVLRESGSTIGFGTISTGGVANNAITNVKLAQMATLTIKGNNTGGASDPLDLTAAQARGILQNLGSMTFQYASTNLADNTTYYWGTVFDATAATTAAIRQTVFPFAVTIIGVSVTVTASGLGTSEAVPISLRVNNTTDHALVSVDYDTNGATFSATGLSISLAANDLAEIKAVIPLIMITNPIGTRTAVTIWYYRT